MAEMLLEAMKLVSNNLGGGVCGGAGLTCAGDNDWQGLDRLRVIPLGVGSILQLNSYDAHDHLRAWCFTSTLLTSPYYF